MNSKMKLGVVLVPEHRHKIYEGFDCAFLSGFKQVLHTFNKLLKRD